VYEYEYEVTNTVETTTLTNETTERETTAERTVTVLTNGTATATRDVVTGTATRDVVTGTATRVGTATRTVTETYTGTSTNPADDIRGSVYAIAMSNGDGDPLLDGNGDQIYEVQLQRDVVQSYEITEEYQVVETQEYQITEEQ
jgi:hypothetical protein